MNVNKNFKENLGLKKFIDNHKKINESITENSNINYCSTDEKGEILYNKNKNINNLKFKNNLIGKKPSLKTAAMNRPRKSTDLNINLKNSKINNLKEDLSISDLINKSNEDFIKMKKMFEKNSNKNSKQNLLKNNGNQNKKDLFDLEINNSNSNNKIHKNNIQNASILNFNRSKEKIYNLNSCNNEEIIDSENMHLNILDENTLLKIENFNSKHYENARKKARNNYNKNNCSIPAEITDFNSVYDGYVFLNTEVKERPKSNLGEFHTYNSNNRNYDCLQEERINTIQDFSSSKNNKSLKFSKKNKTNVLGFCFIFKI